MLLDAASSIFHSYFVGEWELFYIPLMLLYNVLINSKYQILKILTPTNLTFKKFFIHWNSAANNNA